MFCDLNSQSSLVIQFRLDHHEALTTVNTSATYREIGRPATLGPAGEFAHTVTTTTNVRRNPNGDDSDRRISTSVSCNERMSVHTTEPRLDGTANHYTSDPFVFDNSAYSASTSRQPEFHGHMDFDRFEPGKPQGTDTAVVVDRSFHPSFDSSTIEMPSGNFTPDEASPFLEDEKTGWTEEQLGEGVAMGPFLVDTQHFHPTFAQIMPRAQSQPMPMRNNFEPWRSDDSGRQPVFELPTGHQLSCAPPQHSNDKPIRQIERTGDWATDGKGESPDVQLDYSGSTTNITSPYSQEISAPWVRQYDVGRILDDDANSSVFTSELSFNHHSRNSPPYHSVMSENDSSVYYEAAQGSTSPRPSSTVIESPTPVEVNGNEQKFGSLDLHLSSQPQPDYPAAFKEAEGELSINVCHRSFGSFSCCQSACCPEAILFCFPQLRRRKESATAGVLRAAGGA